MDEISLIQWYAFANLYASAYFLVSLYDQSNNVRLNNVDETFMKFEKVEINEQAYAITKDYIHLLQTLFFFVIIR